MASLKKFRRVYFTFVLIYLFNIGITNSSKLDHISGHSQGRNLCNSVKSDFSSLKLETNHDIYIQGNFLYLYLYKHYLKQYVNYQMFCFIIYIFFLHI